MDRELRHELYLALLLLGADEMLLGTVRAWCEGVDERAARAELRNWNEAKLSEIKEWLPTMTGAEREVLQERVRQYGEARGGLKRAA